MRHYINQKRLRLKPTDALTLAKFAFFILSLILDGLACFGSRPFITTILNFFVKAVSRRFFLFFLPRNRALLLLMFSGLYLDSAWLLSSAFLLHNFLGESMISLLLYEDSIELAIQALAVLRLENLRPSGLMKSSALFWPWRRLTMILLQSLGSLGLESCTEERVYILLSGGGKLTGQPGWSSTAWIRSHLVSHPTPPL